MSNLFQQTDLIIFDLDGTLYEDTEHFSYYAKMLMRELDQYLWEDFKEEYRRIEHGQHVVTIGKVYDVVRDHVLQVDPTSLRVLRAWNWAGDQISESDRAKHYPSPLTFDFETMIAIGDGWWLPNVCAKHFGASETQTAYHKTKEFMTSDQFQLTQIPFLRETLLHLKSKKDTVLLTNSQEDDVQRLLHRLELDGIFDLVITDAKKPQYTERHFSELLQKFQLNAEQCLSIGDNYMNEIAPALKLGMKTILIDFYQLDYPEYKGVKVQSISDTLSMMREIQ